MSEAPEAPKAISLLLTLVAVFSLFRYLHDLAKLLLEAPFIDFAHYYTYATVVRHGLDPFDPEAVASVDDVLKIRRAGAAANYPPLFYLLMQPWTLLSFRAAAVTWFLTSQGLLVAALGFCRRSFASAPPVHVAAALFVVLNYQPLIEDLALVQANVLLLFLVTLAGGGCGTAMRGLRPGPWR